MGRRILGQRLDELEDVSVATRLLDLLLSDLLRGLGRTEQDVEADGTGVERRFLRHQRDRLPVLRNVVLRDRLTVELRTNILSAS